jgi:hypothetical protein
MSIGNFENRLTQEFNVDEASMIQKNALLCLCLINHFAHNMYRLYRRFIDTYDVNVEAVIKNLRIYYFLGLPRSVTGIALLTLSNLCKHECVIFWSVSGL